MHAEAARQAAERADWARVHDLYSALDDSKLTAEDLEIKGDAAWWMSRVDDAIVARQKSFEKYLARGEDRRAARLAWLLYYDFLIKGNAVVASGWLRRAHRHLEGEPECSEHGLVMLAEAAIAKDGGALARAEQLVEATADLAARCGSRDLAVLALDLLGRIRIAAGRVVEGSQLLDEAMSAVIAGELEPLSTGFVYCNVISTCLINADLRRAGEWAAAAREWCDDFSDVTPFHGLCRAYHARVNVLFGAWEVAHDEALRAIDESEGLESFIAAEAWYAIGEIRRRRGDLKDAEAAFHTAHQLGRNPQPGLALARASAGDPSGALAALRSAHAAGVASPLERAELLGAQVDVATGSNRSEPARMAASELDELAVSSGAAAIAALAASARATVELAFGAAPMALILARRALDLWLDLKLPYEIARSRMLLADACRTNGDELSARLEIEAAVSVFERLGARADAKAAADVFGDPQAPPARLSAREVEVLRLVAAGRTNREIAGELVISPHTVSRHLQNIFTKLEVSTRAAATAFAFERDIV